MGEYVSTQTLVIHQWAGPSVVAQHAPDSTPELNEDWYTERGRGKIERGRGKITGRKERKKKIQLHLWDSNPQPLAYMTSALPLVLRGSLKW